MAKEIFLVVDDDTMPCPAVCTWGLQDVSANESGRTDDTLMHKNRVGQKRKLDLQWNAKDRNVAHIIIKAFNPEYIDVTYWDLLDGKYETRTFYAGDRSAPYKCWWDGKRIFESVSFNIIER